MNQRQPKTLEEYVTLRYAEDLNNVGYQPVVEEGAEEMISDAMEMMARMNMVTQNIHMRMNGRQGQFGQASA
ncbi:MAG: hypothetical protein KC474_01150 [Cyanobacteria bacterium HKST-UBA04]|nr:hypothetical protein [Cyanobacteria bacterium HKST-UBA04]MCA9841010.1 hypothetical protein [Cyanobacteria bacterium HKST-UBA03]